MTFMSVVKHLFTVKICEIRMFSQPLKELRRRSQCQHVVPTIGGRSCTCASKFAFRARGQVCFGRKVCEDVQKEKV